jgi:hypothetical protein
MKPSQYVTFDICPLVSVKDPKAPSHASLKYEMFVKFKKELATLAKAKRFTLTNSFKVVFILPYKEDSHLDGDPHLTGNNTLIRLVEAVRQALLGDKDIYRVDASKYWGKEGKIIIRNFTAPDFDQLRQIK